MPYNYQKFKRTLKNIKRTQKMWFLCPFLIFKVIYRTTSESAYNGLTLF